ncbi:MAG: AfsR/SARP family transcriptional regulator, partial [Nakamurella sp.]
MHIDLLGTIGVHGTAESGSVVGAALGGRRAHLALASLALSRQMLSPDTLADHIWGEQPPPTWPVALRGLIGGLRRALAPIEDGTAVIVTDHGGYRIGPEVRTDVDRAAGDLERATQLAAAGRSRSARDLAEPISRLGGSQLLLGEDADWIRPHRRRVDALALHALEVVVKASTELGDHRAAVASARQAVATSGLDERSHRALIRALDAAGDRAGAVQAYDACRAVLADELGIDPSVETTQTYLAALGAQSVATKARLPLDTSSFHGRVDELAGLAAELASPGLLAIVGRGGVGRGGVGKSRLALETVSAATHFVGGRFWVSLAALSEDDLVASTVAVDMGVAVGTDDPTAAIATELAPLGRTLLVLDGCEQVIDGAASLAGALNARCPALTILVTSRVPLSVDRAKQLSVAPFGVPTAEDLGHSPLVALLAARVADGGGRLRIDDDHAPHLQALLAWCAGLPLAVELVAGQLAGTSVADLLDALPAANPAGVDTLRGVTS